jgi:hypothetical protein
MPRKITIHKPTHKFFGPGGTPAMAIGQMRGDFLYLNRFDDAGKLVEKSWAVGSCAYHLTGYGKGVDVAAEPLAGDQMERAWRYTFGTDVPSPTRCELHKPA